MTREERLAAGWVECWGARSPTGLWWTGYTAQGGETWMEKARHRWNFGSAREAAKWILSVPNLDGNAQRFWKRWRKPKAPPPLAVGDEVVVRGEVEHAGDRCLVVKIGGHSFGIPANCVERVKP